MSDEYIPPMELVIQEAQAEYEYEIAMERDNDEHLRETR